eukprot:CAMPEP_0172518444 /NCGR_PEP_ID=MMETSP1066-20121228/290828_1 /TAXON_ID=671091 /ORGANISM="Coscinodiscus wailesii, Strain CCMP2513" /LENGTH=231 /DNA_ID=CAMNT_0013300847 /DNA_START=582 /DNA_END=1275 /DNA_ORIENTATION=-
MKGKGHDEIWMMRYEQLKMFQTRNGHCSVPQNFNENKALGMWVNTQRYQYKLMMDNKRSQMTLPRVNKLNEIDFDWCVNNEAWQKRYDELKAFKARTGGLLRIKLDDIEFDWCVNKDDVWQKRYDELKAFKARTGHCRGPQRFAENKALGMWVSNQRKQYKLMMENKPSQMTLPRVNSLDDIEFDWCVNKDDVWQKRYDELKLFKARKGHCRVPQNFAENKALGMWVSNQR